MDSFESLISFDSFSWQQLQQQPDFPAAGDAFSEVLQRLALGSDYAITQLAKYPALLPALKTLQGFDLDEPQLATALHDLTEHDEIKKQLRLFRHQKMVEIIYLDICQHESVENILLHISELADYLIRQAQSKAEQLLSARHGQPVDSMGEPMTLNIIGMGKLGGRELNFSSDIDLICCFSEEGELDGFRKLSHSEYFIRVVRLLKEFLHEATADGFVYRVDLRLRPWGDSGPVALSHSAFEHYYQLHGREWEQYAMVKARVITGSVADRAALQAILKPFVYRRYHDYRVFDGLAQLKNQIDHQARQQGKTNNVKLGSGGIREIEFFVQAFQILKGGRNHQLQTQSIFQAMDILAEQNIVEAETIAAMRSAYCFLRRLENRIQMMNDQQTHEIPSQQNQLQRIALTLDYADSAALMHDLQQQQAFVSGQFATLFNADDDAHPQGIDWMRLSEQQQLDYLQQLGFSEPEDIRRQLDEFHRSSAIIYMSDKATQRFQSFFPELLKQIAAQAQQQQLLQRMLALLSSIAGRSVYFEFLYQNIPLLQKLVQIFASSAWIAEQVTRHPMLLESILYPDALDQRFDHARLQTELDIQLNNVARDVEMELDVLRQFKRAQTLVIASAEISAEISALQVSHYLSELAEILLQAVYRLAWREMVEPHGEPGCLIDGRSYTPGLGIIAYGKLGGFELHYQSDLDIIFLHDSRGEQQFTRGEKQLDNAVFFARLAQKIISKINLRIAAGQLYETDTRLRPDGASGMLVSSLAAYQQYQRDKAWMWEHQALIRARFVAGEVAIKKPFETIRCEVMQLPRDEAKLQQAVRDMRDKMYQAKKPPENERINLKHSRGCMVDIEFLVQFWVLLHANKFASLCETTDNIGLLTALHKSGLITDQQLQLRNIYQKLHELLHARVLQNQSAEIPASEIQPLIEQVRACWNTTFNHNAAS
jgi:glutamate-ammonia-ligase adenylyltransferase